MSKIGVIATYTEFITLTRKAAAELNQDISIKLATLEKGIKLSRIMCEDNDVQAIISRGPTGKMIKNNLDIPVVVVEITNFDLIKAFYNAKSIGERIVFIDFYQEKPEYDLNVVTQILGINIRHRSFNKISEIVNIVDEECRNGADVVVSTAECIIKEARLRNVKGILVNVETKDIVDAMEIANTTINERKKEMEKAKWLKTILNNMYEGTIIIDDKDEIRIFNKSAEELLDIKCKNIVGKKIYEFDSESFIKQIYGDGKKTTGDIIDFKDNKIAINRFPIFLNSVFNGVIITLQKVSKIQEIEGKIRKNLHSKGFVAKSNFKGIIGNSIKMKILKERAVKYGKADSNVLIIGDSGTGKELFAQSIHNVSKRKNGPFVAINCASLTANLLESELFGYEEGAFTGAKKGGKLGLFELAHNGTLFLDEIGEIPLSLQSRLLRVIQEKEVMRIGGNRIIPVNTRIICATNINLRKKVIENRFRKDLFYRINILKLNIPALNERKEDIPLIAYKFLNRMSKNINVNIKDFEILKNYDWPGNVRELENFIERFIVLSENKNFNRDFLNEVLNEFINDNKDYSIENRNLNNKNCVSIEIGDIDYMEKQVVRMLNEKYNGDKNKISDILGISRTTLWRKHGNIFEK